MNYFEQLKDGRWIRKRKKIIERDGHKCTACGSDEELVVHHTFYYKAPTAPWHYPDYSLLTLCDSCHHKWHYHHDNDYKNSPRKHHPNKRQRRRIKAFRKLNPINQ